MRIALFSDVHGNPYALDAVLGDIADNGGVDAYWVLGDLAKLGPDPAGVLERLVALENAVFVRGNSDHYLVTGTTPFPGAEDIEDDLSLLPRFEIVSRQTGWTQGMVTAAGYFEWLAALPTEQRLVLPDGTRLLGVHASPGNHSGPGFHPNLDESEMASLLDGCKADLVCVGHTHWPMDVHVGPVHLVNLGSVSFHPSAHVYSSYVQLEADETGYQIEHRRVDYDQRAAVAHVRSSHYPNGQFIIDGILGKVTFGWE